MELWESLGSPGYFGTKRDKKYAEYDSQYGKGNWRISWEWNDKYLSFGQACQIYETAYFVDSQNRFELWFGLMNEASEVYDIEEKDVESGLDYLVQKGPATHIQDIAIRNVALKRGFKFKGKELVQIRGSRSKKTFYGEELHPGVVPFHEPELIRTPHVVGWWKKDSVEDFYQSNKTLQIRKVA